MYSQFCVWGGCFSATSPGTRDLSSPTRDRTCSLQWKHRGLPSGPPGNPGKALWRCAGAFPLGSWPLMLPEPRGSESASRPIFSDSLRPRGL